MCAVEGMVPSVQQKWRCTMIMNILMWTGIAFVAFLFICGLVAIWRGRCGCNKSNCTT